jgi:CRISPR-associated protein (Cas_Cas02710).
LNLAEAYAYWDLFDHIKFRAAYGKVNFNCAGELTAFKASEETLSSVHQIGKTLKQGKLTDLTIVDLINNARRRIEEGKYDDATARLYRAIEMLAQWWLQEKHQIDTSNVDISRAPEKSQEWLKGCATGKNKEIQLPLYKAYQLLSDLGQELGKDFFADNALRDLLKNRNESILAHGRNPMSKDNVLKLLKKAEEFTMKVIKDYESKSSNLLFPWQKKEIN